MVDSLRDHRQAHSPDPYRLRAVGHSLGGAALLIYLVTSLRKKRPHHVYRLILLTPAGFLKHYPPKVRLLGRRAYLMNRDSQLI